MGIVWTPESRKANGGTEQLCRELEKYVDASLLDNFQIFASKVSVDLDPTKIRLLWCHDRADDPAVAHLANEGWKLFHRIVFVSHMQKQSYIERFSIPVSRCVVMLNAIEPVAPHTKPDIKDGINFIYTSTPHRGLNLAAAVFAALCDRYDDLHFHVYSSFKLYNWNDADETFRELFDYIDGHPKMTNHGAVHKTELYQALSNAHIFAYPSTWAETSCRCLMEAMSADLVCVHSDFGALPETAANWTIQYGVNENPEKHAGTFMTALDIAIQSVRGNQKTPMQKIYADTFYSWQNRSHQWTAFLGSLLDEDRSIPSITPTFKYKVG